MLMKEKIARAIGDRYEVSGLKGIRRIRPSDEILNDIADAVLEAMMTPDDRMRLAALPFVGGLGAPAHSDADVQWQAMITSARKGEG